MKYIKPHYYDTFRCAADRCPDTCCAGWQIMIDDDSLERYSQLRGSFGSRVAGAVDWEEGCLSQYKGTCALLSENNLCDMVTELGEEYLCETCSRYPRHMEEYKGVREMSLSLSCPVAAEMILSCKEGLVLLQEEDGAEEPLEEEFVDFDSPLYTRLENARNVIFQLVQGKVGQGEDGRFCGICACPLERRMDMTLRLAEQIQAYVDDGKVYDVDALLQKFAGDCMVELPNEDCILSEKKRFLKLREGFAVLEGLERLRDGWEEVLAGAWNTLYSRGEEHYLDIRREFLQEYGSGGKYYEEWELFLKNLLLFFFYTYFCGAVYDDWIYSKAALAVFSAVYVQEFVMFRFIASDKNIDKHDWVELAYRYSREIEHSDNNLNLLEEVFQGSRRDKERN